MNWLERFLLRRLAKKVVRQGFHHRANIIEFYTAVTDAARAEFCEDNKPTLDGFLTECHEESLS